MRSNRIGQSIQTSQANSYSRVTPYSVPWSPEIFGIYIVKLIVAMTLISSVAQIPIRAESHLLMVGAPGTSKSQFLRYSAKVSSHLVLTTGIVTTSARFSVTDVR